MKKIISRILIAYALAVLLCTLYLNQCIAQNPKQNKTSLSEYSVRGKVTDTHNVPMPGVTVRYNHIIGTATDNDGNFTLRLPEETGTLTFSFIGYKTLNIPFTAGVPLSVRMTEEQFQRLERYRELTRLPVTTYFRKLIAESEIVERPSRIRFRLHEEVNKIDSNIRQILRNPRAKELDREATDGIRFLLEHILEQAYHIKAHHDLSHKDGQ